MEKDKWISDKISKLIKEGKTKEQSIAMAIGMWDGRHTMQPGGSVVDPPKYDSNFTSLNNTFGSGAPYTYNMPSGDIRLPNFALNALPPNPQEADPYNAQFAPFKKSNFTDLTNSFQSNSGAYNYNTQPSNAATNGYSSFGAPIAQPVAEVNPTQAGTTAQSQTTSQTQAEPTTQGLTNEQKMAQINSDLETYETADGKRKQAEMTAWVNNLHNSNNPENKPGNNRNEIYNPKIINPYGGISLEQSLSYAGQGFGEKDYKKAALGTGLSFLKGARTFLGGVGYGRENERVDNEFNKNLYETEPLYNSQQGGTILMEEGGEITNAEYMTGEFIAQEEGANVEIEDGEHTKNAETGQIQTAVGEKHDKGGVPVALPNGSKVLSDYTEIGGKNAKMFKEEFGIKVKASDTFATVMDKVNKKIGLDNLVDEEAKGTEKLADQIKSDTQKTTKEINIKHLQHELQETAEEKQQIKPEQDRAFEIIFAEQEKIPKKEQTEMKYGGQLKALAKKYGVDPESIQKIMKQGGVTDSHLEKFQEGGKYRGMQELKATARNLGYEGNYDFTLDGENTNEELRKMQQFIAEKAPDLVVDYFTKYGQAITADGVDMIKKTSPETFKKAGIAVPSNSADLTEEQRRKLQATYTEEGKATPEFWKTQFVDGRYAYRAPMAGVPTTKSGIDTSMEFTSAVIPKNVGGIPTANVSAYMDNEVETIDPKTGKKVRGKGQNTNALMPQDFLLPPNAMESVFKAQADLSRLEATKLSPEAKLASIESQRQVAAQQIAELPEAQQAAAYAQMLGTTQQSSNQAVSETDLANQASAAQVQLYNAQATDKEGLLNQQFMQDYEQKIFAAKNNTDKDLRQYFSDLNDQNRFNFNYIDRRNLFNQAPYNYKYDGEQLVFNNESILPQQQKNEWTPQELKAFEALTAQQEMAEKKRLTELYNNKSN